MSRALVNYLKYKMGGKVPKKYDFGGLASTIFNPGDEGQWDKNNGAYMNKSKSNWGDNNIGNILGDSGKLIADNGLSLFGASNVINDASYKTQGMSNVSKVTNPLAKVAGTVAASAIGGPLAGMALGQVQGITGGLGKQGTPNEYDKIGGIASQLAGIGTMFMNPQAGKPVPTFANGGQINNTMINVEGSGKQVGDRSVLGKEGELLVSSGNVKQSFVGLPPHPKSGMDPRGNVDVQPGTIVIPKKYSKEYLMRSAADRKRMEASIVSQQALRAKTGKFGGGGLIDQFLPDALKTKPDTYNNYVSIQPDQYQSNTVASVDPSLYGSNPIAKPTMIGQDTPPATQDKEYGVMDLFKTNGQVDKGSAAAMGLNLLPAAYNIGKGLFGKVDTQNPNDFYVKPDLKFNKLTDQASIQANQEGYNLGYYNMKNSGRFNQMGQVALASSKMKADAMARERIANINAEGQFRTDTANKEIEGRNKQVRMTIEDTNAKNKSKKEEFLGKGLEGLSNLGSFALYNKQFFENLHKAYPRYK